MRFVNTDVHTRTWNRLVNAETLTTLHLAPGEEAHVQQFLTPLDEEGAPTGPAALQDLPADFDDPYLKAVTEPAADPPAKGSKKTAEPTPSPTPSPAPEKE